jgi:hypothetical protein
MEPLKATEVIFLTASRKLPKPSRGFRWLCAITLMTLEDEEAFMNVAIQMYNGMLSSLQPL